MVHSIPQTTITLYIIIWPSRVLKILGKYEMNDTVFYTFDNKGQIIQTYFSGGCLIKGTIW